MERKRWMSLRKIGVAGKRVDKQLSPGDDGKRLRKAALHDLDDARTAFAAYMGESKSTLWEHKDELADLPGPCPICAQAEIDRAKHGGY